jgi:hypothetical protein
MFLQLFKQLFTLPATQPTQHSQGQDASNTGSEEASSTRNALLSQQLLVLVHGTVSRAMFSKDHLSLALHLARHLHPQQFPDHEWAVLLSCSSAVVGASSSSTPAAGDSQQSRVPAAAGASVPAWLGAERAAAFEQIAASLPELVLVARLQDSRIWGPWDLAPGGGGVGASGTAVPVAVSSALTVLQQLILVAAFQSERWGNGSLLKRQACVGRNSCCKCAQCANLITYSAATPACLLPTVLQLPGCCHEACMPAAAATQPAPGPCRDAAAAAGAGQQQQQRQHIGMRACAVCHHSWCRSQPGACCIC